MPSTVYHICRHDGRSPDAGYAGKYDDAPNGAPHAASPARDARLTHGSSTAPDDGWSPTGPQHAWNETGMKQMCFMFIKDIYVNNCRYYISRNTWEADTNWTQIHVTIKTI